MDATDAAALDVAADRLVAFTGAKAVYLFGSRARGDHDEDSDWDVCVVLPEDVEHGRFTPLKLWPLVSDLGLSIQVVALRESVFEADRTDVNSLSHDVARDGVLLRGVDRNVDAPRLRESAMAELRLAQLITSDPQVVSGRRVFRGTRVPVEILFENLADGMSIDEIVSEYPTLSKDDLVAVLECHERLERTRVVVRPEDLPDSVVERIESLAASSPNEPDLIVGSG